MGCCWRTIVDQNHEPKDGLFCNVIVRDPVQQNTWIYDSNGIYSEGTAGKAATITVGATTTGEPGTDAKVENVGDVSQAVLNFTIPRGDKGDKGEQGDPGSQGPQGEPGPKGDQGEPFQIRKIYDSVDSMEADYNNPGIEEGDFVLINTDDVSDPDNAKLYVKGPTGWQFVTDLSGAQGIQGPQGDPGTPAGFGNVTATVDNTTGTPQVSVQADGPNTAKNISFSFTGLKGEKGEKGDPGQDGTQVNNLAPLVVDNAPSSFDNSSVAIGNNARASFSDSIAIGANAVTSGGNTVSFGSSTNTRRIIYVTDPRDAQDAATKNYVDTKISEIPTGTQINSILPLTVETPPDQGSGTGNILFGDNVRITSGGALDGVGIGVDVITSYRAVSIGSNANARTLAIAIGFHSYAEGYGSNTGGIALGENANTRDSAAVAIGANSSVTRPSGGRAQNSVALGSYSSATEEGVVSVGSGATTLTLSDDMTEEEQAIARLASDVPTRRIVNVTDPRDAQDAATKNYVDTQLAPISALQNTVNQQAETIAQLQQTITQLQATINNLTLETERI